MPLRYELPAKMVCPTARFHRYRACLQLRSERQHRCPLHAPSQNNRSRLVKARQAAEILAEVDAKHDNLHGSAPSRSGNQNR
jgi:hypothetical protein